jgi:polynucleotide 5'-hydroxyl-kinase GRC3/NOL9
LSYHWVHLVKGPAVVTLEGFGKVLGKDVSNNQISVGEGKILPFEIGCDCKIVINGGKSRLVSRYDFGTAIWHQIIRRIFLENVITVRKILIVGDTDTGKSSLATYITNEAIKRGYRPGIIDADIGQGDLAPPNAIGAAVVTEQITDLRGVNTHFYEFVGNTNPVGFEDLIIKAVKRILAKITTACDICIINTDGYILNTGIEYKLKMAKEIRSDMLICLGKASLLNNFKSKLDSSYVVFGRSPSKTTKSRIDRSKRRLSQFQRYFKEQSRTKVIAKELSYTKFVYRGQTYSGMWIDRNGFSRLNKSKTLPVKLRRPEGMFVGLGMNKEIVGFGLVLNASRHQLAIQSSANDFNKIHLSNSGICKKDSTGIRYAK